METSDHARRLDIRKHRGFLIACAPFALAGCVALWYAWVNAKAARMVDEHTAWIESMGYPVSMDAYSRTPENPDDDMLQHPAVLAELAKPEHDRLNRINDENFGHRIDGLAKFGMKLANRHDGEVADVRTFFDPARHETDAEAARELLDALAPEIERARNLAEALARPMLGWQVGRSGNEDNTPHVPEMLKVYQMSLMISDAAILHLSVGDIDESARMVDALFDLSSHLSTPPFGTYGVFMSDMAFMAVDRIIYDGCDRGAWNDAHLAAFDSRLEELNLVARVLKGMKWEMTYSADLLQQFRNKGMVWEPEDNPFREWNREGIRELTQEIHMTVRPRGDTLMRMMRAWRLFHDQGLMKYGTPRTHFEKSEFDDFRSRHEAADKTLDIEPQAWADEELFIFTRQLFEMKCSAILLRTGIALERHRLAHDIHPDSLDELVPAFLTEVPIDPCDGAPLRYRIQTDDTALVWSIGLNGVDDGGTPNSDWKKGDRVWATAPIKKAE